MNKDQNFEDSPLCNGVRDRLELLQVRWKLFVWVSLLEVSNLTSESNFIERVNTEKVNHCDGDREIPL